MKDKRPLMVECLDLSENKMWVPVKNIVRVTPNERDWGRLCIYFTSDAGQTEFATCTEIDAHKAMEFIE
jgi:hypothetical protein